MSRKQLRSAYASRTTFDFQLGHLTNFVVGRRGLGYIHRCPFTRTQPPPPPLRGGVSGLEVPYPPPLIGGAASAFRHLVSKTLKDLINLFIISRRHQIIQKLPVTEYQAEIVS